MPRMVSDPRVAPSRVREAFARGVALVDAGYGGRNLQPDTVRWARKLARGEPLDRAKARRLRAWLRRHGPAVFEAAARARDPHSPASVAWLLWGAQPHIPWSPRSADPVNAWVRAFEAFFELPPLPSGQRSHRKRVHVAV